VKGETYLLPYLCTSLLICFFVFHSPIYLIKFVLTFYLFIPLFTCIVYYFISLFIYLLFYLSLYLFPYFCVFGYLCIYSLVESNLQRRSCCFTPVVSMGLGRFHPFTGYEGP